MTRPALSLIALGAVLALVPAALAQQMTSSPPAPPSEMAPPAQAVPGDPGVTAAMPVPNPPPRTDSANPNSNADTGYSGQTYGATFRDIDQRISALEPRVGRNRKASSQLRAIKSEEAVRRARHGGELRDWDRELLNKKLDAVDAMVGAG